jgi:SAM-dependent methyltransferase
MILVGVAAEKSTRNAMENNMKNSKEIKKIVKNRYKEIAVSGSSCGCGCSSAKSVSKSIGYSEEELKIVGEANLGLGCGNPLAFGKIEEGDVVLDLGSGAGIDAILAAKKVGSKGRVIGVDMTEEMVEKAKENAKKQGIKNAEFLLGEIENLPLKDNSVDTIITNCVINLTPDKTKTFSEAYRVLKPGGSIYLSDIVLLKELSDEQRNDKDLLSGCVAGALLKDDYLDKIKNAGFKVRIIYENKGISKEQYNGIALESLMVELTK